MEITCTCIPCATRTETYTFASQTRSWEKLDFGGARPHLHYPTFTFLRSISNLSGYVCSLIYYIWWKLEHCMYTRARRIQRVGEVAPLCRVRSTTTNQTGGRSYHQDVSSWVVTECGWIQNEWMKLEGSPTVVHRCCWKDELLQIVVSFALHTDVSSILSDLILLL